MKEYILIILLGVVCIFIGISNMKGNISLLHSYHTKNVSEENKRAFGKLVGLGTAICGVGLIAYCVLSYIGTLRAEPQLENVASGLMIGGFVIGLGIAFFGMLKYNKGVF